MTNNTKTLPTVEAVKAGDWVLPVTVDGVTVYALQINKSAEDKANIEAIHGAYVEAGIPVYTYSGKGGKPVLLVEATKKIKAQRTSASTESLIASAVAMFGVTEEQARAMVANAKANK